MSERSELFVIRKLLLSFLVMFICGVGCAFVQTGYFSAATTVSAATTPSADTTVSEASTGLVAKSVDPSYYPESFLPTILSLEPNKGKLLLWEQVKERMPLKTVFEVIDLETGLRFDVQIRGGTDHADVQPLTVEDTRIMKQLYGGKWSWDRRAVLVKVEDELIAGSMNGMPHGAGALQNGFPGHFCLHFYGSKIHGSRNTDLAHHLMITKEAGQRESFLKQLSASEVVDAFFIGLHHQDLSLIQMLMPSDPHFQIADIAEAVQDIEYAYWRSTFPDEDSAVVAEEITVDINLKFKEGGEVKKKVGFYLEKNLLEGSWQIIEPPQIPWN
jgi:hypothetical protein